MLPCVQNAADWDNALRAEITGLSSRAIRLSRFHWVSRDQSAHVQFPKYLTIDLTPIAKGLDGSWIAWTSQDRPTNCPMLLSPRDEEFALIIGDRFWDAVYWLVVDELRDCWLEKGDSVMSVWKLQDWLPRLNRFLTDAQSKFLESTLSAVPVKTPSNGYQFVGDADYQKAILLHAGYAGQQQRIRQYQPR